MGVGPVVLVACGITRGITGFWSSILLGFPVTDGDVPRIAQPVLFVDFRLGVLLPSWVVRLGSAVIRFLGTHLADRRKDHGSMGDASAC
jgi:hypothetical protein